MKKAKNKTYKVTWQIELDAENPRKAAKEAFDSIVNGSGKVFIVQEISGTVNTIKHEIDLEEED